MMMQQLGVGFGFDLCWELGNLGQPGWRCILFFVFYIYFYMFRIYVFSIYVFCILEFTLLNLCWEQAKLCQPGWLWILYLCSLYLCILYFRIFTFLYFVFLYCWELGNLGQGGDAACSLSWLVRYLPNLSSNPPHFLMPWKISISHSGFLET